MGTTLLIIDAQNDFMDIPGATLPVKGAMSDIVNLSSMIAEKGDLINRIVVTLDQHPHHHIAHAMMWVNNKGKHPKPFTRITYEDIQAGRWWGVYHEQIQHDYVRDLETIGGSLTIWPPHCITGSWGANIVPMLCWDLKQWVNPHRHVKFFNKSGNWSTEQYSSFMAAIVRADDPSTGFNQRLYDEIQDDEILIAGEALSHCVAQTVLDATRMSYNHDIANRMILLRDCTSPVAGCADMAEEFLRTFEGRGGRVMKSTEVLPIEYSC